MPLGKVSSGDFRKGTPITLPHTFGNPVNVPDPKGNVIPQSNLTLNGNPVTWLPSPAHFGNSVELLLQSVPPIVIIEAGSIGSVSIPITDLTGLVDSVTFSYTGAPTGVTVSFAPNPSTTSTTAEITVAASVPLGKYTITVHGSVAGVDLEDVNVNLVVVQTIQSGSAFGFLLEDGTGVILLEDGSILLLEVQS